MPSKSSSLDVLPSMLLRSCANVFAQVITTLANLSLQSGRFPSCYKKSQMLPLLKKPGLDSSSSANYRSISNLSAVFNVLEMLSCWLACVHTCWDLPINFSQFQQFQSAYRKGRSTETALHKVLDSVFTTANDKQVTVLIPRLVSGVWQVNHSILLERLQSEFGVTRTPLAWLQSYLEGRTQFVKLGLHQSPVAEPKVGVPRGSVLELVLFAVHCSQVEDVITDNSVHYHQYADDAQLHLAVSTDNTAARLSVFAACTAV